MYTLTGTYKYLSLYLYIAINAFFKRKYFLRFQNTRMTFLSNVLKLNNEVEGLLSFDVIDSTGVVLEKR